MIHGATKKWTQWLPFAEWWYNTNYHSSLNLTPFEALYGYPPSVFDLQDPKSTTIAAVEDKLQHQQEVISELRNNLARAQNRQKQQADKNRSERSFQVGEKVYLKLHPYKQKSMAAGKHPKLAPRFYGPFLILKKLGEVAYELKLPPSAAIHPVPNVENLRKEILDEAHSSAYAMHP
ncbi:Transposon Tf2-11 polyprotein [Linum perenne]